ncbi:MAG: THAP domain-containing protein, partial [bacterium]
MEWEIVEFVEVLIMVRDCAVEHCETNCRQYDSRKVYKIPDKKPVFKFPTNRPELYQQWIKFVVGDDGCAPLGSKGICILHFEKKYVNMGKRATLKWNMNPIPSIYQPNENTDDLINTFNELNSSFCPPDYQFMVEDDIATFYRIDKNICFNIPEIVETITIDRSLHVRLFLRSSPIPLPEWFRSNGKCRLTRKSILENFPAYIRNYVEIKETEISILTELQQLQFRKPVDGPRYSSNLLRFALLLRYASLQAYKLLLDHFPLPSVSYLRKLCEGGVEPLKGAKLLLEQGKVDADVIMMLDELFLRKEEQYTGGDLLGCDKNGVLYKGIMTFMIVGIRKSIPWVVKAIPETKIEGTWLANHIDETIGSVHQAGFKIRGIVADDHSTNVLGYNVLLEKYPSPIYRTIRHPSNEELLIYLFFDSVHLMKNIRNNLLNHKRFIFPEFSFDIFNDVSFPGGEISWKLLHDVHDRDSLISANLKKAYKISNKVLHPGDNKQSVPLALAIFDPTTFTAIESYY